MANNNPYEGNSSFGGSGSNPLFAGVWDVLGPDIERRRATEQSIQDTKVKALLEKLWTTPGITPEEEEATLQEALSVYKGNKTIKDMIQQMHDTHKAFMPVMDKMNPGLRRSSEGSGPPRAGHVGGMTDTGVMGAPPPLTGMSMAGPKPVESTPASGDELKNLEWLGSPTEIPSSAPSRYKPVGPQPTSAPQPAVTEPDGFIGPRMPPPPPVASGPYAALISAAAQKYNLDPRLLEAVMETESGGQADIKAGDFAKTGSRGLGQVTENTARSMGFTGDMSEMDRPEVSIEYMAKYLRQIQDIQGVGTDPYKTYLGYNGGPGGVTNPTQLGLSNAARFMTIYGGSGGGPRISPEIEPPIQRIPPAPRYVMGVPPPPTGTIGALPPQAKPEASMLPGSPSMPPMTALEPPPAPSPLQSARAKMHPDPVAQAEAVRRQQQLDEETKYNREQAGRVQIAGMQKPDQSIQPFDVWRQQNPDAPISEWIALTDTAKGSTPGFTDEVITVDGKGPVAAVRQGNEYFVPNTNPPQKIAGTIGPYEKPDRETGGGLSLPVMSRVDAIAARFEKGETVKIYNDIATRKQLMMDIINDPKGPSGPGDLAIIYEFMKALDPSSVVRESERKDAEKSGNIFAGVWAQFNGLFNPSGGSLSPQAKQDFLKTVGRRLNSVEKQYANEYKETLRKINNVTGGKNGSDYVTNYDIGLGRDIVQPQSTPPGAAGGGTGGASVDDAMNALKGLK